MDFSSWWVRQDYYRHFLSPFTHSSYHLFTPSLVQWLHEFLCSNCVDWLSCQKCKLLLSSGVRIHYTAGASRFFCRWPELPALVLFKQNILLIFLICESCSWKLQVPGTFFQTVQTYFSRTWNSLKEICPERSRRLNIYISPNLFLMWVWPIRFTSIILPEISILLNFLWCVFSLWFLARTWLTNWFSGLYEWRCFLSRCWIAHLRFDFTEHLG